MNKPFMIMMVGLPGSGKSTLASHIAIEDGAVVICEDANPENAPVIHSSDELRKELFGDENDQSNNDKLFVELHRRIKEDLISGKDVVFDATNINKKQRRSFLDELKNIACYKVCIAVMTPFENCLINNLKRERRVPEKAIHKMLLNWQPPHYHEGFDYIHLSFLVDEDNKKYLVKDLHNEMLDFDQENSHHAFSLGGHSDAAYRYCKRNYPEDECLYYAAFLHDIGKLKTKTRVNRKGIEDGECHYFQHQCVGAYMAGFYLVNANFGLEEMVDIMNLIYFHMHPYGAWKQSDKAAERDKSMIGEDMYNRIMALHEADLAAH